MEGNDKKVNAFFELMRCGIWGTHPNPYIFKGLTNSDWQELYKIAAKQQMLGVCLQPILDLPKDLQPFPDLLLPWIGMQQFIEANIQKKIEVWHEFYAALTEAGFTPVVFKGFSVARWYAHPQSRQFGDIDIYIPEKFDELLRWLKGLGIESKRISHHDVINYKTITIEIHSNIINVPYKPKLTWKIVEDVFYDGVTVKTPDLNMYCFILLTHAAGHFFITGIGYKFLCDWAVFLQKNHDKIDTELVFKEINRMGMQRFVAEFTKLAEIRLGLNFNGIDKWTQGSNDKYLSLFSQRVFELGDLGARKFRENENRDTLAYRWKAAKRLFALRYYWPKYFWRRIPLYLCIFGIITVMRRLHLQVNYNWLNFEI